MAQENYKKDIMETINLSVEVLAPDLEEIKNKHENIEDIKEEIDIMVGGWVACNIFDRELDDKELDIFMETYHHMLYYTPAINGIIERLNERVGKTK